MNESATRAPGTSVRLKRERALAAVAGLTALLACFPERESVAASKEECVEVHSRGQDLREKGQLTRARQLFLACAQSACPDLVQADCARFGDDLDHLVPSVAFAARDAKGLDLPDTNVYVDDVLVATRLDDGRSYELDPGRHAVRFVHEGKETLLGPILNQGEKGRTLVATFTDLGAAPDRGAAPAAQPPQPARSSSPLIVAGLGAASVAAGATLIAIGAHRVPEGCSIASKECATPPGDPAIDAAHRGVSLANIGLGVGVTGAGLLVGGLVWYAVQPAAPPARTGRAPGVEPLVGSGVGGVLVSGRF
jgi:hypothetical protein